VLNRRITYASSHAANSFDALTCAEPLVGKRERHGVVRRMSRIVGFLNWESAARASFAYRLKGEGLESKTLLSAVLGWSAGKAGNQNSAINPANISDLKEQYALPVDGLIVAEPLSATVDIVVGPKAGIQPVVFVATENDWLYAFNDTTGQLQWKTNLLAAGQAPLSPLVTQSYTDGVTSTRVIDRSTNPIYLVTRESYDSEGTSITTRPS
jgi:hypothetical protein